MRWTRDDLEFKESDFPRAKDAAGLGVQWLETGVWVLTSAAKSGDQIHGAIRFTHSVPHLQSTYEKWVSSKYLG